MRQMQSGAGKWQENNPAKSGCKDMMQKTSYQSSRIECHVISNFTRKYGLKSSLQIGALVSVINRISELVVAPMGLPLSNEMKCHIKTRL